MVKAESLTGTRLTSACLLEQKMIAGNQTHLRCFKCEGQYGFSLNDPKGLKMGKQLTGKEMNVASLKSDKIRWEMWH